MKIEERAILEEISKILMPDRRMVPFPRGNIRRATIQRINNNNNNTNTMIPAKRRNFNMFHPNIQPWAPHGKQLIEVEKRRIVGALELTKHNFKTVIDSTELVMVYFYTRWDKFCEFSMPLFDEAADDVREQYPDAKLVVLGKLNGDKEGSINHDYRITTYPTIKVFRNGELLRGKYKGAFLPDAVRSYVTKELENPIKQFYELKELVNANNVKRIIVGYFDHENMTEYDNFRRIAQTLKQFGDFYVKFGSESDATNPPKAPIINFTPECTSACDTEETFQGCANNYDELNIWAHKVFMVQEMAHDNLQKLIGDRYPLLILYYDPNNSACVREFKDIIANTMMNRKHNVNFAVANGLEFTDCIEKYGKEVMDLPLVAIESLNHVFLFPHSVDITVPEKLKEFLHEFDIGKLQYIARTGGVWTKQVSFLENPRNNFDFE